MLGTGVGEVITGLLMLKEMRSQASLPWGDALATQVALVVALPFIVDSARRNVIEEIER
jgi:hypothetical protein